MAVAFDVSGALRKLPAAQAVGMLGQASPFGYQRVSEPVLFADASLPSMLVTLDVLYSSQPVVAGVVNKLVRSFASVPLKVYRMDASGDRVRVREGSGEPGADLAQLLETPAPRRGPTNLKQWMSMPTMVFGNGVIAKYRPNPNKPPIGLLPLDWRHLSAYAPLGEPVQWWASTQISASPQWLKAEDVMHFAWDSPSSSAGIGVAPLEQLAKTLLLEDAARRFQVSNFMNTSRMGGMLSKAAGERFDVAEIETLRESLEGVHQGPDRQGRIGILPPGYTWYNTQFNAVESALMDARQFNRVEVCIAYDVKPPIIGDMERSNYSSLVELNRDFWKTTMKPWLTMAEETIKAQLIDSEPAWADLGLFVEFDLSDVLRGDPLQEAQAIETQIQSAQLTPNEGRRIRNLAPDDDPAADELYLPVNNLQPIGSLPQRVRAPAEDPAAVLRSPTSLPQISSAADAPEPPPE